MIASNIYIIGLLITLVVGAICMVMIVVSLKWYKPGRSVSGILSVVTVGVIITGFATVDMFRDMGREELVNPKEPFALYKQLYWQDNDHPEYALSAAKKLWEAQPSNDIKLALGLAYLGADQKERGLPILQELASVSISETLMPKSEIDQLLNQVNVVADGQELTTLVKESVTSILDRLKRSVNDSVEKEMIILAELDPDRLNYLYKVSDGVTLDRENKIAIVNQMYLDVMADPPADPLYRVEMAKTAIYMGDEKQARDLLTDLVRDYPSAVEPSLLLGSLLLNSQHPIPNVELKLLPHYSQAKLRADREWKRLFNEWSSEVKVGDEQQANIQSNQELAQHVAYVILDSLPVQSQQKDYLLSMYYYQNHQADKSADLIHSIADDSSQLTLQQQYYIQSLQILPEPNEMTLTELQERNALTADVYRSFRTLGGNRLKEVVPTDQERSFAVHLSNELIHLNKSRIRISSIHASEDGSVELYVNADNLDQLTPSSMKIQDNEHIVKDFKVEKIGDSVHYKRNIVMIIDQSGSMEGDPLSSSIIAIQNFVAGLSGKEEVGVVAFSDGSSVLSPITSNHTAVSAAVGSMQAGGGTNIAGAFGTGIELIAGIGGERLLFMVSDGEDSNFSQAGTRAEIINRANAAGITIFAVGFNTGYETLRDVAEATGGKYVSASGLVDLMSNFAEISKTLESSYKVSYILDPMKKGHHRVTLRGPKNTDATKTYNIGGNELDTDAATEADDTIRIEDSSTDDMNFAITSTLPNRITASRLGTTEVQILGEGLDQVSKVNFDKKDIVFKRVSDSRLDIRVSNNLSIGAHPIKLIGKDQRELTYQLSVAISGEQDFRVFGDSRVYGDFIEDRDNQSIIVGNTSVDYFLYDTRGQMLLDNRTVLSFSGLQVDVDRTKIGLLPALGTDAGNLTERFFPDDVKMTVGSNGKTFTITRSNSVRDVLDKGTFAKFGLEVYLNPKITYEAKYGGTKGGTLKSKMSIKGFGNVQGLHMKLTKKLVETFKFLPTDALLEVGYSPETIAVKGEAAIKVDLKKLVNISSVKASVGYVHGLAKLDLGVDIGGSADQGKIKLLSFDLSDLKLSKIGVKLGWQASLVPKAGEVSINRSKGIALGQSGLAVRGFKIGMDFRNGFGGALGTEISTIADGPTQEVIKWVNKIPLVNLPESACLLCVEGEAGALNLGTDSWSINGLLKQKVIGFEMGNSTLYFDKNEINSSVKIEPLKLNGTSRLLWRDINYKGDTTLNVNGTIDIMGLDGKFITFVNMVRFENSYLDVKAEAWTFSPHIQLGADPVVYR